MSGAQFNWWILVPTHNYQNRYRCPAKGCFFETPNEGEAHWCVNGWAEKAVIGRIDRNAKGGGS